MESQYNLRNPGVKRLMREAQELREPTELYFAQPIQDNLFEWHFTIRGPSDSEFDGGFYHGRISLPPEYPLKPPSVLLLTPNGRFEVNRKICLSISGHHPESWQPSWSIRTALLALIAFMPTPAAGALGSLDYPKDERRRLARKSHDWVCPDCGGPIHKHLLPLLATTPAAPSSVTSNSPDSEMISRISFKAEAPTEAAAAAASKPATVSTTSSASASSSPTAATSSTSALPSVSASASPPAAANPPAFAWSSWPNAFGGPQMPVFGAGGAGAPFAGGGVAGAPYGAFPFAMPMPAFLPPPPPPPPPEVLEQWLRYLSVAFQPPSPAPSSAPAPSASDPTSVLPAPSATSPSVPIPSSVSSVSVVRSADLDAGNASSVSRNDPFSRSSGEPDRERSASLEQQQQQQHRETRVASAGSSSTSGDVSCASSSDPMRLSSGSVSASASTPGASELRHRHPERRSAEEDEQRANETDVGSARASAASSQPAPAAADLPQDLAGAGEAEAQQQQGTSERDTLLPFIKALIVAIVILVSLRLLDVVW